MQNVGCVDVCAMAAGAGGISMAGGLAVGGMENVVGMPSTGLALARSGLT